MSTQKRYVIEGEWSGYTSNQRRICHRTITTRPNRYRQIRSFRFTDGTSMTITIRPCLYRERVQLLNGYTELIEKAANTKLSGAVDIRDVPD